MCVSAQPCACRDKHLGIYSVVTVLRLEDVGMEWLIPTFSATLALPLPTCSTRGSAVFSSFITCSFSSSVCTNPGQSDT